VTGANSVPLVITGAPGASVSYTLTEGNKYSLSGTGVIGATGKYGTSVDVSPWPDGTLTVTATLTGGGAPSQSLTQIIGKNSTTPPAPSVSSNAWTGPYSGDTTFTVNVTGQVGSIATVVITDGMPGASGQVEGMDQIGSTGTLSVPLDVSFLADGTLTISVTLTNANGNSGATTTTAILDTDPPPLSVSAPAYINNTNQTSVPITVYGEPGDTVSLTITGSAGNTVNATRGSIPASGKWNYNPSLSSLVNGPVTLSVTEVDPANNQASSTTTLYKMVQTVATPTVALNPASDSGVSSSDYITNVTTPKFTTSDATAGTTVTVYLNGVAYAAGQSLAAGSYTVTAVAGDAYGNVSAAGTAAQKLQVVTSPPTGSWTISGGKVINGVLSTNNKTPALTLSFSDPGGISTMSVSINGGVSYSTPVAYASSTSVSLTGGDGTYTITVQLTDVAGNVGFYTQKVVLDTTGPTISASLSPAQISSGGYYNGTADITISSSATDTSGVSAIKIVLDSATTITNGVIDVDTLLAGSHTVVVTATDGLGNSSTYTLPFVLHPSRSGIGNAVNEGVARGLITSSEGTKLLSILNNTAYSLTTDLNNVLAEIKNQSGKAITTAEANVLTSWANDDLKTLY
jgi:hypothetical protein